MAEPGKKAELDADGINLQQKKNNEPEKTDSKKAELDKGGLSSEISQKAALDKEGMSFFKKIQQTISHSAESFKKTAENGGEVPGRLRFTLPPWFKLAALGLCAVLVLGMGLGSLLWYMTKPAPQVKKAAPPIVQTVKAPVNEGEILLEPFMVMYEPRTDTKAGILIVQMSLRVNPKIAANVKNKLYEIRSILHKDLAKNALVYTQFELVEMMKEHLRLYDVADITFVKFDLG